MTTKIIYVVASDETDYYLEQTLISIYSVKIYNPEATVVLIVDQFTDKTITGSRAEILNYITQKKIVIVPENLTKKQRSRYLKTTIRQNIQGNFLYIDSDTVITKSLIDIDSVHADIGAVLDRHSCLNDHPMKANIDTDIRKIGLSLERMENTYFNGGVLYVRDVPKAHRLFDEWHQKWKCGLNAGIDIDQPALAKANFNCGNVITELSGEWNCQIYENSLRYFVDAYILHYFASNKRGIYLLDKKSLYILVRENGGITNEIDNLIRNAKTSFEEKSLICSRSEMEFLRSKTYLIFRYHTFVFRIFERISGFLINIDQFYGGLVQQKKNI